MTHDINIKKWKVLLFLFWSLTFDWYQHVTSSSWNLSKFKNHNSHRLTWMCSNGEKNRFILTNELYVCRRWWYYDACSDLPCNLCFATLWNNCKRRIRGYLYMFRCLNTEINRILRDLPKKRKELLLKYNYYS